MSEIDYGNLGSKKSKDRRSRLLSELDEIDDIGFSDTDDDMEPPYTTHSETQESKKPKEFLPSKMDKRLKDRESVMDPNAYQDKWFNDMLEYSDLKLKKPKKKNIFQEALEEAGGKKKKKKKKDDELTDYNKEFEPELALLRNLLIDQNQFVATLQREYEHLTGSKSSSRGITKNLTDLISNITSARSLSMQLVDKHTSLKKTIADLTMKEKKEKAGLLGEGSDDLNSFAANYLKQLINERQMVMNGGGSTEIGTMSNDEMADLVSENLLSDDGNNTLEERSEEVDRYLKYENRHVEIYVEMNSEDEDDYEYVAKDENGEIIDDYPLPYKNRLTTNRSTGIATDVYGQKYKIIWR